MKKKLWLLLLLVLPICVFADGGVTGSMTTSVSTLTVEKGKTQTFNILITHAEGFGSVVIKDGSVVKTDISKFETGQQGPNKTATIKVTVTGLELGTTQIVVKADDMATYSPIKDLSGQENIITVKVVENVKNNPNTGDTIMYIVLLLTLGILIYSYWYVSKSQEN